MVIPIGIPCMILPYSSNLNILPLKVEWVFSKVSFMINCGEMSIGSLRCAIELSRSSNVPENMTGR